MADPFKHPDGVKAQDISMYKRGLARKASIQNEAERLKSRGGKPNTPASERTQFTERKEALEEAGGKMAEGAPKGGYLKSGKATKKAYDKYLDENYNE